MNKKLMGPLAAVVVVAVLAYLFLPGLIGRWARDSERKTAGLQEKSLRVDDHEIVYLEGGNGEPILMIHGFAANKESWTRFAKFITPAYHVVAVDLPGFGDSSYLQTASYNIADQARRLDQVANAIGLKKFHIVGNSMGGHIAGRYAVMYPEKVLTLGLFASSGVKSPVQSELATILSKGEPNPLIATSVDEFDRLIKFVFFAPPEIPGFAKKLMVKDALKHKASNERILKQLMPELQGLELDLGKITAKTLVLWGDHDRCLDVSAVQIFQKGLGDCSTAIMKDCGHVPMIERPQEAAAHYLTFLKNR